tara:strand:- start:112 stop:606 length:495 start_codon:yes stop_codon:yes gene_type:complete
MGFEIERRFIVEGNEWKKFIQTSEQLKQGYLLANESDWTIRIRIINNKDAFLTLKRPKGGITRFEFEYPVPLHDAEELFEIAKYSIKKKRYHLTLDSKDWVVDCFQDQNHPLVLAEIELKSNNESIRKPSWCIKEVSHLKEWSNAALAKLPISRRPIAKTTGIL